MKLNERGRALMSKVVVVGSGFAGHTAALYLRKWLTPEHQVTVISAQPFFQFTPSLVWVGVGHMNVEATQFLLEPVYRKKQISFIHDMVIEVNVEAKSVLLKSGKTVAYDYLILATGPYLNFAGTPGLGPAAGNTTSICTPNHALEARDKYLACVERMKRGEKLTFVIGTGHAGATCQGAAFEYIHNIHNDLLAKGLRQNCHLIWFTNEPYAGDFGIGGITARYGKQLRNSAQLVRWLMKDAGIQVMDGAAPLKIEPGKLFWENVQGEQGELNFDFAMLIPQFLGARIKYTNNSGEDISDQVCNPAGFVKVDADYTSGSKPMHEWSAADWPSTYQSAYSPYIFAAGIAFAPPHPISPPSGTTVSGIKVQAAPPRTGMISGIIGKVVAANVAELASGRSGVPSQRLSLAQMPAACIASQRKSVLTGSAVSMILYPVVPDYSRYSTEEGGRDIRYTAFEIGKGNAWLKRLLHSAFMYKLKGNPGWAYIPE